MKLKHLFLLTPLLILPLALQGQTNWTGNGDGTTWTDANNWSNGLPSYTNTARFGGGTNQTRNITFSSDVQSRELSILNSTINSTFTFTSSNGARIYFRDTEELIGLGYLNNESLNTTVIFNTDFVFGREDTSLNSLIDIVTRGTDNHYVFNGGFYADLPAGVGVGNRNGRYRGLGSGGSVTLNAASEFTFFQHGGGNGGEGEANVLITNHQQALGTGGMQVTSSGSRLALRSDLNLGQNGGYSILYNDANQEDYFYVYADGNGSDTPVNVSLNLEGRLQGSGSMYLDEGVNGGGTVTINLSSTNGNGHTLATITGVTGHLLRFLQNGNMQVKSVISGGLAVEINSPNTGNTTRFNSAAEDAYTYTGGTRIVKGTLKMEENNTLPIGGALEIGATGIFDANSISQTLGALSGTGQILLGTANLTINSNTDSEFGGSITGTTSTFTKQGSGTALFTGNATFTGNSTVSEGKLLINGNWASQAITVASGAHLGGTGTLAGDVSVLAGGHLAPGNSPGILNIEGETTLAEGSVFTIHINGTAVGTEYSQLSGDDSFNINGATLELVLGPDYTPTNGDMFTIVTLSGGNVNGLFQQGYAINVGGTLFEISYSPTEIILTYSFIPETSTTVLIAGIALLALLFIRRKHTASQGV